MPQFELHCCDADWLLQNRKCELIVTDTPFAYTNEHGREFTRDGTTDLHYHNFGEWDNIDYEEFHDHYVPYMLNCASKAVYIHCPVERLGYFQSRWPDYYKGHIIQCVRNPVPSFYKNTYRMATVALAYFHLSGKINWLGHREMFTWQTTTVCNVGEKIYWHFQNEAVQFCPGKRQCDMCQDGIERHSHPTQKRVDQVLTPIFASSDEGDTVIDPFVGVGTTAVGAISTNRNVICGDNKQLYVDITAMRLASEVNNA